MCKFAWNKKQGKLNSKNAILHVLKKIEGKDAYVEIASREIDFSKHFGEEFGKKTVQMHMADAERTTIVKSVTFHA